MCVGNLFFLKSQYELRHSNCVVSLLKSYLMKNSDTEILLSSEIETKKKIYFPTNHIEYRLVVYVRLKPANICIGQFVSVLP